MWTLSAVQLHKCACIVCDEDATGELRVRTVRYFKGLEKVHMELLGNEATRPPVGSAAAADEVRQNHLDQDWAMAHAANASRPDLKHCDTCTCEQQCTYANAQWLAQCCAAGDGAGRNEGG